MNLDTIRVCQDDKASSSVPRLVLVFIVIVLCCNTSKAETNSASSALNKAASLGKLAIDYGQNKNLSLNNRRKYYCKFSRDKLTWLKAGLVDVKAVHEASLALNNIFAREALSGSNIDTKITGINLEEVQSLVTDAEKTIDNCSDNGH